MIQQIQNKAELPELLAREDMVAVDFWAPWCGPCQALNPVLEHVAQHTDGVATLAKVNVDDHRELALQHGIRSIPTLVYFRNGQEVARSGIETAESITERIEGLRLQKA